jgi:hypothetical protein
MISCIKTSVHFLTNSWGLVKLSSFPVPVSPERVREKETYKEKGKEK